MKLSNLFTDDGAVSPVIGVILMVAITVILAAVIGAFVLNIGGSQDTAPQASFEFSFHNTTAATINHEGGSEITKGTVDINVGGTTVYDGSGGSFDGSWATGDSDDSNWNDPITAANSIYLEASNDQNGNDVDVVWSSPNSDKSSIIGGAEWSA